MKTINQHLYWGKQYLDEHGIEDANLSTKILLSFATGIATIEFIKNPDTELAHDASERFQELICKRGEDVPIAYLVGEKEFYSHVFQVNQHVLIPRPETETLIDWFGQKIGNQSVTVCDVGTGSGAIAITLKKNFQNLDVTAVDISLDALEVAKKNARQLKAEVNFIQSNLLEGVVGRFEVIVANLPYVPIGDIPRLSKAVQYEPKLALESGVDGLDHYRKLLPQAKAKLLAKGAIFLEFGQGQKDALISLLQSQSFSSIEVMPDLAGIDRVIYGIKQ